MDLLMTHPGLAIAAIIILGALAQWLAWRINVPAILPLLVTGFLLGPVFGLLNPSELFGQDVLFPAVSLAVSLILFEGGLTLRMSELREIGVVVRRLITIGGVVTWLIIALAAWLIMDMGGGLSVLFGALLMVTGPTVIGPLLRIVRPVQRVANVLKWEGILIDAIGAMVAALVFTFLVNMEAGQAVSQTLLTLVRFIVVGSVVGTVFGYVLANLLKLRRIPDFLVNLISLAFVFAAFEGSNFFASESGLLATTIMGIIIANTSVPNFRSILNFKEDLTVLVISVLFIVLAANIEFGTLLQVMNWQMLLLLVVIMLVARPLTIFLCTLGTKFTLQEKLFLSWIAPRGIVAASVSSLFASRLTDVGYEGAEVLVPMVFMVIVGTVLLNSLTALPLARRLKVAEPDPQGFLILGAHPFARLLGEYLAGKDFTVLLADTNYSNVSAARKLGLRAYYGSLLSERSDDDVRLSGIGRLLALTSNEEANALTSLKYSKLFGSSEVYRLQSDHPAGARGSIGAGTGGRIAFLGGQTYYDLRRAVDAGARIQEMTVPEDGKLPGYPLFELVNGSLDIYTSEDEAPEPGTRVAVLTQA